MVLRNNVAVQQYGSRCFGKIDRAGSTFDRPGDHTQGTGRSSFGDRGDHIRKSGRIRKGHSGVTSPIGVGDSRNSGVLRSNDPVPRGLAKSYPGAGNLHKGRPCPLGDTTLTSTQVTRPASNSRREVSKGKRRPCRGRKRATEKLKKKGVERRAHFRKEQGKKQQRRPLASG